MTSEFHSRWTVWLLSTGLISWTVLFGDCVNVRAADGGRLAKGHLCSGHCETCPPPKAARGASQHPYVRAGHPHQVSRFAKLF